jgi:hypothetical protein
VIADAGGPRLTALAPAELLRAFEPPVLDRIPASPF